MTAIGFLFGAGFANTMIKFNKLDVTLATVFWLGLAVTVAVYMPGLNGIFIFDDIPNLSKLGESGGVKDFESFMRYVFGGVAGPTGRPVALLSFLLNANSWPTSPWSFKYVNLLIHLLNGVLLFTLLKNLAAVVEGGREKVSFPVLMAALLASLAWLLHPYLVSTTMYVIQRMAQLAMLFSLLGLLAWLKGRLLVAERPRAGYVWMTAGLILGGAFAALSKENGALLPLLAWSIEVTLFHSVMIRSPSIAPLNPLWRSVFFTLPWLLIVTYLLFLGFDNGWFADYPNREFSPVERLLTQCRVIFDYLHHWFVPRMYTSGVFYDHYQLSLNLLQPLSTIFSVLGLVLLCVLSWFYRTRYPLVSLAIIFFLASQLLESTTVPLELVFEHRMYLGGALLFFPAFYYLWKRESFLVPASASLLIVLILAVFCWRGAGLWGEYPAMIHVWAEKVPDSPRAQSKLASLYFNAGQYEKSQEILDDAVRKSPNSFPLHAARLLSQCHLAGASEEEKMRVLELAEKSLYRATWQNIMRTLLELPGDENCKGLSYEYFIAVVDQFLKHPRNKQRDRMAYAQLLHAQGLAYLFSGNHEQALNAFEKSNFKYNDAGKLMNVAMFLANAGLHSEAKSYAILALEKVRGSTMMRRSHFSMPRELEIKLFIKNLEENSAEHG